MNKTISPEIVEAEELAYEYQRLHQKLQPSDLILVLGNRDTRVIERAAQIYLEGLGKKILISGGKANTIGRRSGVYSELSEARAKSSLLLYIFS